MEIIFGDTIQDTIQDTIEEIAFAILCDKTGCGDAKTAYQFIAESLDLSDGELGIVAVYLEIKRNRQN